MAAKEEAAESATGEAGASARGGVNPQIVDSVKEVQKLMLSPEIVRRTGAGGAYLIAAQAAAIAIQDATSYLRSMATVNVAAVSVATALLAETGAPRYGEILRELQVGLKEALSYYKEVGESAAQVLKEMPTE